MIEPLDSIAKLGHLPLERNGAALFEEEWRDSLYELVLSTTGELKKDVTWGAVVSKCADLLKTQSKDLWLARYLCVGLFQENGYEGLNVGLTVLRDLITHYWKTTLYPAKAQLGQRINEIEHLAEQIIPRIKASSESSEENKQPLLGLIAEIHVLLRQEITEATIEDFLRQREDLEKKKPPEQGRKKSKEELAAELFLGKLANLFKPPKTDDTPPSDSETKTKSPPTPSEEGPKWDLEKVKKSLADNISSCREPIHFEKSLHHFIYHLANAWRGRDLKDGRSYRMLRTVAWMGIIGKIAGTGYSPPAVNEIPLSPLKAKLEACRQLGEEIEQIQNQLSLASDKNLRDSTSTKQKCRDLIEQAETLFAEPGSVAYCWLDAHYFTAQALDLLGHKEAKQAVIEEVAHLLRRFPGLEQLYFKDQIPVASPTTKQWIQQQVLTAGQTVGVGSDKSGEGRSQSPWQIAADQARLSTEFEPGFRILQEGGSKAASQREQFYWWLELARWCYDRDQLELSMAQLEFLEEQVQRFHLETWEPQLSVAVARLFLQCSQKQADRNQPTTQDKQIETNKRFYARLSRLEVATVFLELLK